MDHSHEFYSVKAEKHLAMRKYRNQKKLKWFFEACVALFLLMQSSTWFPIVSDFSGKLFQEMISVFKSHLFIFALFNVILLAVYVLSGRFPKPKVDVGSEPDLYDEFVTNSELSRRIPAGDFSPAQDNSRPSAETVLSENAGSVCNRNDAKPNGSVCTEKEEEEEKKALVEKRYQRTQSVRFEERNEIVDRSRKDFRRSCTDICRKLTCSREEATAAAVAVEASSVNRMSNEEFNRTIEAFIAAKKWIQMEESKEERKTEQYTALTVCQ